MKKKVLIMIALIVVLGVGLVVLTGCGENTNNSENNSSKKDSVETKENTVVTIGDETYKLDSDRDLNNIHYKENYVDFNTDQVGNMRTMSFNKEGKTIFEIRVMYDENRSDSELKAIVETQTGAKEQLKEINDIKYIYYEYTTDDGLTAHHYMYVYNGKVYTIGFFLGENPGNIEKVFMNHVRFE